MPTFKKSTDYKMKGFSGFGNSPLKQNDRPDPTYEGTDYYGPKGVSRFGGAFAQAKKEGLKTFTWEGKKYHTQTKEEQEQTIAGQTLVKSKKGGYKFGGDYVDPPDTKISDPEGHVEIGPSGQVIDHNYMYKDVDKDSLTITGISKKQ